MIGSNSQIKCFVIFFQGRVGSTYLIEIMASHPEIFAVGEKFHDRRKNPAVQLAAMREFLIPTNVQGYRAIGFKTKLHDVGDPKGLAKLLREQRAYLIYLGRRNRVKHAISWIMAHHLYQTTGDWNLYKHEDRPAATAISPTDFQTSLKWVEERNQALIDYVMSLELPTLSLYYEDLLTNEQENIRLALSFLGVQPLAEKGNAIKVTDDDLRNVLVNFEELRSFYAGTRYEQMFDEIILSREPTGQSVSSVK